MQDIDKILEPPVNLAGVMDAIPFDDADVVAAAENQATLFLEAARFRVQALRARTTKEAEVTLARSQRSLVVRSAAVSKGVKISENHVREKLDTYSVVLQLETELRRLVEQEEFSKLLLEAMRQRRDSIEVIQRINSSEFGVLRGFEKTDHIREIREVLQAKYPGRK